MCGICGEIDIRNQEISFRTLKRMCDVLAHRGPDDEGVVLFKKDKFFEFKKPLPNHFDQNGFIAGLGHRRLSIIDLSEAAHQPMSNENGTIWIVYNGEIYNYREIRNKLESKGHLFKSRSDTEVIIHAYEEWGIECLKYFRGMFAFGLWDNRVKKLFLARDRFGKKPLVYSHKNGRFTFASELKALIQVPWIERKINPSSIHYFLTYQYIPSPESIFEEIKKLPPAHYLLYDSNGNIKIERYWELKFNSYEKLKDNNKKYCEIIKTNLEEAVKYRLISDVPLGAFLSGGIDSSLIVGTMAQNGGPPVKTFSIGFEEEDFDELDFARVVSKHFGTDHHEFIVRPNAIEILPKLVWHYNEPFADSSAIPTYYVAKMTSDYVKVVLTGDAGDENFAGYPRYLRSKYVLWFTKLPETLRKDILNYILRTFSNLPWRQRTINRLNDFIRTLSSHQGENYVEQIRVFDEKEKKQIYSKEYLNQVINIDAKEYLITKFEEPDIKNPLERLLYLDMMTYLPEDLLVKVDIATMAHSLEARIPFLDHIFIEKIAQIPFEYKLRGLKLKFILKKAFSDFLPETILKRKKMGFGVPISKWLRKELKDYMFEILLDNRMIERGYFKRDGIKKLLDDHISMRYDNSAKIWALLFLEVWFRVFMDKEGV